MPAKAPQPVATGSDVSGHDALLTNPFKIRCLGSRRQGGGCLGSAPGPERVGAETCIAPDNTPFAISSPFACLLTPGRHHPPAGYDENENESIVAVDGSRLVDGRLREHGRRREERGRECSWCCGPEAAAEPKPSPQTQPTAETAAEAAAHPQPSPSPKLSLKLSLKLAAAAVETAAETAADRPSGEREPADLCLLTGASLGPDPAAICGRLVVWLDPLFTFTVSLTRTAHQLAAQWTVSAGTISSPRGVYISF
jgi:hypothetical protein